MPNGGTLRIGLRLFPGKFEPWLPFAMRLADILSPELGDNPLPNHHQVDFSPSQGSSSTNWNKTLLELDRRITLIHDKGSTVTVQDILEAATADSFYSYLKAHNLEHNDKCKEEFTKYRDLRTLRQGKLMRKPAYATVSRYLLVAQFSVYLSLIPNKDGKIDICSLKLTDARELASKLCFDIGNPPRSLPDLLVSAEAKQGAERIAVLGGSNLEGPPSWCVHKAEWDRVAAQVREAYYAKGTAQRRRRRTGEQTSDNEEFRRPAKLCWVHTNPQAFPAQLGL